MMAGLMDSLNSMLTPDVVSQVSNALGIDPAVLQKGIGVAEAATVGSLSRSAGTPEGAQALLGKLPADTGGDLLGNLMSSLTGGTGGTQADMVTSLLGNGANAIGGTLSQKLGFDVRPLLNMAVPMVAGMLTKMISESKLDAAGVSSLLTTERDQFMNNPANRDTAGMISEALEAGDKAAALRDTFTGDEWMAVRTAPMAAVYLVASASPSGGSGSSKELAAAVSAVSEAVSTSAPTSIIGSGFGGGLSGDEIEMLQRDAPPRERMLETISRAVTLVDQKSPADAQAYRDMVLDTARRTADAAKEGGFLGFGGKQVSEQEQAVMAEISAAVAKSAERGS